VPVRRKPRRSPRRSSEKKSRFSPPSILALLMATRFLVPHDLFRRSFTVAAVYLSVRSSTPSHLLMLWPHWSSCADPQPRRGRVHTGGSSDAAEPSPSVTLRALLIFLGLAVLFGYPLISSASRTSRRPFRVTFDRPSTARAGLAISFVSTSRELVERNSSHSRRSRRDSVSQPSRWQARSRRFCH